MQKKKQSENERIDILSNEQWEQLEKEHPYVDLLTDIGFKHVFGNPANKKLLIDFLIAAMDSQAKIKYIHMIDRERDLRNQFQFATDKGIAEGIEIGREEGRAEGFAEGMENGRAEGRAEGVSNVARKLKAMGVDYKTIVESTGLSIEEIEAL